MHKKYNKFLIISTTFIALGIVFFYSLNDIQNEKIIPVVYGSSLVSSTTVDNSSSTSSKITSDFSFLSSLFSLKKMSIDTSFFSDKNFNSLKNNSVTLEKVVPGRNNPFAPIGNEGGVITNTSKITTNNATLITNNSVTLNGSVNVVEGVGDVYFKYGLTNDLGTISPAVKQQMVGTFIKNILGLNSKTTYYYTACAKINNLESCGDVVSFITN